MPSEVEMIGDWGGWGGAWGLGRVGRGLGIGEGEEKIGDLQGYGLRIYKSTEKIGNWGG